MLGEQVIADAALGSEPFKMMGEVVSSFLDRLRPLDRVLGDEVEEGRAG